MNEAYFEEAGVAEATIGNPAEIQHPDIIQHTETSQIIGSHVLKISPVSNQEGNWRFSAKCKTTDAILLPLFFSQEEKNIAKAKSFCGDCEVKKQCLASALERKEPWGVWGGRLLMNGRIVR